jgi:RNA polymerase sigma-70 factor (ECF subfamily)
VVATCGWLAAATPVAASEQRVVLAAVRAVKAGDREAFGRLVELYQARIFALALMMTRDRSGAEEVAQDAFLQAFTRLELYDESRPFHPWLATIAVRLAQTWLRRRLRVVAREGTALAPEAEPAQATADALDTLIAGERSGCLWRSVAALTSGERTVVALYYRQGLAVKDVARALGVTSGTVKTLLFRARRRLRHLVDVAGEGRQRE